jgi:membrane-bound lytic murein transglycosylase D
MNSTRQHFAGAVITFIIVAAIFILAGSAGEPSVTAIESKDKPAGYAVNSVKIPDQIDIFKEYVPVENFDVQEGIDRELLINTYWQSQTLLFIKRANRYFPVIEELLEKNGVPDDFKYLALAESGLQNIISSAEAVGYWQFVKPTALEYNLEVNDEIDERYSIEKSTEAACKFFKESYNTYRNWTLAAASYNLGRTGLNNQLSRQKVNNYYDLYLNEETARYIYRIIALKLILENPTDYGFFIDKSDLYKPIKYKTIEVNGSIPDFADFAYEHGTNYKMIKLLNPWLREKCLTNSSGKTYFIKIPEKGYRETSTSENTVIQFDTANIADTSSDL